MAEQVILDISIPTDDIEKAEQDISRARKQVEQLREANKNLDKSSSAYTKNAVEIKKLSGDIRTNERVLVANTKAQQANEGSVEQLREQLKVVSAQWAKVTKAEGENTDQAQQLTKQKKELTEQLKAVEKSTGDTRRNVGNYSEGMKEALQQTGLFEREQRALAVTQKAVRVATGGGTKAMKAFKIALAGTGIGAIVIALGSLVTYLTQTQKGMDLVNQVMDGAKAIFQVLIDRLLGFGEGLKAIFVDGDFSGGIDKLKNSFSGLGEEIVNESKVAADLRAELQRIDKAEARLNVRRAKSRAEIEKLKFAAEDQTKSNEERAEAAEKAITKEQELLQETIDLQKQRIEVIRQQNEQGTVTEADLERRRQAEIELANLQEESVAKQIELNNKLNTLRKDAASEREARQKELAEKQEELRAKREEEAEKQLQREIDRAERQADEEINTLKRQLVEQEITREEYNERLEEMQLAALMSRKAILEEAGEDTLEIERRILDQRLAMQDEETENVKKNAKAQEKVKELSENQKLDATQSTLDTAASLFGEQTAAYKILASTQAVIDTYRAANTALATIPPPGGQIIAAVNIAAGLANVAKINAQSVPSFAEGVIGLDGPGTETSDSIPARISKGESVLTAKATSAYAPQLAEMERSVGNKPNYQLGNKQFQTGIIAAGNNPAISTTRSSAAREQMVADNLSSAKIFLSLTELEERQREFDSAKRKAEISEI